MGAKPELLEVDPSTLSIGANIRRDPHAESLVSSLKSNGMLHPIRARRVADGLEVIDGQRRTLAAIQAGLSTVPVLVVDTSDSGRVFEQYVSNDAREDLTDVDRIRAVQQLALFNLNAGTIAKRTGLTKSTVERAIAIPDTTLELVPEGRLEDLADLAAIEGEPEHEKAAAALAAGDVWRFKQALADVKYRKAETAERARLAAAFPDLTLLDTQPGWNDDRYRPLHGGYRTPKLERSDGTPIELADDFDTARGQVGAALAVHVAGRPGYGDSLTVLALYVDVERLDEAGLRITEEVGVHSGVSDEDRQRWQQEREERELRGREWLATAEPRKEFIASLMQVKQPPTGWADVVLEHVFSADIDQLYSGVTINAIRQMLGLDQLDLDDDTEWDEDGPQALLAEIRTRPDRLPFALLAIAIATYEESVLSYPHGRTNERLPAYLDRLQKWGYDAAAERALLPEATS